MIFREKHIGRTVDCAACGLRGKIIRMDKPHKNYNITVSFPEGFQISYNARGEFVDERVLTLARRGQNETN